jgi:hypothetical protein
MPTSYAVLDSGILLATVRTEMHTEHPRTLIAQLAQRKVQKNRTSAAAVHPLHAGVVVFG